MLNPSRINYASALLMRRFQLVVKCYPVPKKISSLFAIRAELSRIGSIAKRHTLATGISAADPAGMRCVAGGDGMHTRIDIANRHDMTSRFEPGLQLLVPAVAFQHGSGRGLRAKIAQIDCLLEIEFPIQHPDQGL